MRTRVKEFERIKRRIGNDKTLSQHHPFEDSEVIRARGVGVDSTIDRVVGWSVAGSDFRG